MQSVLALYKQIGETPLECIVRFKEAHPEYRDLKMTYAGRLDPIASGLLLVLVGDEVHHKDAYTKLSKTYTCTAILGIATDTYDVLGLPSSYQEEGMGVEFEKVKSLLESSIGTFDQSYPPYSSKTIHGKQMHTLARAGELEGLEIPKRQVTVESITDIAMTTVAMKDLLAEIIEIITHVKGDFRQSYIIESWKDLAEKHPNAHITLVSFKIAVSSGTYIRGIVHELGQQLDPQMGKGACILRLHRERVGGTILDKKI